MQENSRGTVPCNRSAIHSDAHKNQLRVYYNTIYAARQVKFTKYSIDSIGKPGVVCMQEKIQTPHAKIEPLCGSL